MTHTTVNQLLDELKGGNRAVLDQLFPLVYDELKAIARAHRRRWQGDETLGTTALVNEAYLKLVGQGGVRLESRVHFFAVAAKAMRHILSNYARARRRQKRGGDAKSVSLEDVDLMAGTAALSDEHIDVVGALDAALARLDETSPRLSRVVECRFYGGMSIADTAAALGTSPATVKRDWMLARALLYREMRAHQDS
jgi:RNA polymerase sigma factor (TIGR02999 family)